MKYFVTPSGNIVKGNLSPEKTIINGEYFVTRKDQYTTPTQLSNLAKERKNLTEGKVALTEISRSKFSDYGIPIDAGKKKYKKMMGGNITSTVDIEGGKKKKSKKMMGGGVESEADIEAGKKRSKSRSKSTSRSKSRGKSTSRSKSRSRMMKKSTLAAGSSIVNLESLGGKRSKSKSRMTKKSTTSIPKTNATTKPNTKPSNIKTSNATLNVSAGATASSSDKANKQISLADLFKQVSISLGNQASDIIARGGDPTTSLKNNINFFNKN